MLVGKLTSPKDRTMLTTTEYRSLCQQAAASNATARRQIDRRLRVAENVAFRSDPSQWDMLIGIRRAWLPS